MNNDSAPPQLSSPKIHLLIAFIFLVTGFAVYANSLSNPFLLEDKQFFIDNRKNIHGILGDLSASPQDVYFRPVVKVVIRLLYYFLRDSVWPYHFVNILLLCVTAWLLYAVVREIFRDHIMAFLTGLLFLVHPLNGIYVNFVTTIGFLLETIFMILTLKCFWNLVDEKKSIRIIRWGWVFLCWTLALMCHESAMAMPLYLFCLLVFVRKINLQRSFLWMIPVGIYLLIYFLFRLHFASFEHHLFSHFSLLKMNPIEYSASLVKLVLWYLRQLVYPVGVVVIWATPVVHKNVLLFSMCGGMLIGGFLYAMYRCRNSSAGRFGLCCVPAGLLPLSAAALIEPSRGLIIEPYWHIFSSIGFFLFLSSLIVSLRRRRKSIVIYGLAVILFFSWFFISRQNNKIWGNQEDYYTHWLKAAPDYKKVNCFLAQVYQNEKKYDPARACYSRCLTDNPSVKGNVYLNIGIMDLTEGKYKNARKNFETALQYAPDSLSIYTYLGIIAFLEDDLSRAQDYFLFAMKNDRFAILPRLNMASIYKKQGQLDDAVNMYEDILDIDPKHEAALVMLIQIYIEQKNEQKVFSVARRLLEVSRNPETLTNVGNIFAYAHLDQEALKAFRRAIAVYKNFTPAYWELGQFYVNRKQYAGALKVWQEGARIAPQEGRFKKGMSVLEKVVP